MVTDTASPQIPPAAVAGVSAPGAPRAANPAALTVEQLARALGLPAQTVRRHVEDGAPMGTDGTINLIHYAAWLNKRLASASSADAGNTDGD